MTKTALVTGIAGQDGFYLTKLLQTQGIGVVGLCLLSEFDQVVAEHPDVPIIAGDVTDPLSIRAALDYQPDEIYHLAALASAYDSWRRPDQYMTVNAGGTGLLLQSIVDAELKNCRFVLACTADVFGDQPMPVDETCKPKPMTPYGISKAAAWQLVQVYRKRFGLHASAALLGNHESARRPPGFLTTKIARYVAELELDPSLAPLEVWNTSDVRDFLHVADAMQALIAIAQSDLSVDYCVGSGIGRSIGQVIQAMFNYAHIPNWQSHIVDKRSPGDVPSQVVSTYLLKLRGWQPQVPFENLIAELVSTARQQVQHARSETR